MCRAAAHRKEITIPKESWPKLRPANNSDCEGITRLVFNVLGEYDLKPDPASTDADLNDIESSYFKQGGTFLVLEDKVRKTEDGRQKTEFNPQSSVLGPQSSVIIIGAYGLYPMENHTCELRKMYLHKAYRGKGLGKFLMEDALTRARQLGFRTMVLETASVLKEAIALYKSYGFTEFQPDHLSARCDQAYRLELE